MTLIDQIRAKLDWPYRASLPEFTPETQLEQRWFGPVDRATIQFMVDEIVGEEIPDKEAGAWETIGDIVESVEKRRAIPQAVQAVAVPVEPFGLAGFATSILIAGNVQ